MTSKISFVANLAYRVFQFHSATSNHIDNLRRNFNHEVLNQNASKIFSEESNLSDDLSVLFTMVKSLELDDVGFSNNWIQDSIASSAPVMYVHIMENEIFSMGIFILKPGSRIPLHDHPGMFGVLRVLKGSIRCRSFSKISKSLVKPCNSSEKKWQTSDVVVTQLNLDGILTRDTHPSLLTPSDGNLHELESIDGPAIFLDILAPPYDHDLGTRECKFYKEIDLINIPSKIRNQTLEIQEMHSNEDSSSLFYLMEIPQPNDYWCKSIEYQGPSLK